MALQNYRELDPDDFYGQEFEEDGVVSIWLGMENLETPPLGLDVLQDYCGVGAYDHDESATNTFDFALVAVEQLLRPLAYSATFLTTALRAAEARGIGEARYVMAQYNFEYSPVDVKRPLRPDPIFIGAFEYSSGGGSDQ